MQIKSPHKLWTVAGDLNFALAGSVVKTVWLPHWYSKRLKTKKYQNGQISPTTLRGWRFVSVETYGKSLLFKLQSAAGGTRFIACTLGRGRWVIKDIQAYIKPWTPSIYMLFEMLHPSGFQYCLIFYDMSHQGVVEIREHLHELDILHRYGPPIDSPYFTREWVEWVCANSVGYYKGMEKAFRIKSLLMEQRYFAGMTNTMSVETLFLANLHPQMKAKDLSPEQVARLFHAILVIYGSFSKPGHEYMIFRKVSCPVCQTKIERIIQAKNQKTYFCPRCQALDYKPPEPVSEEFVRRVLEISRTVPEQPRGVDAMNARHARLKSLKEAVQSKPAVDEVFSEELSE